MLKELAASVQMEKFDGHPTTKFLKLQHENVDLCAGGVTLHRFFLLSPSFPPLIVVGDVSASAQFATFLDALTFKREPVVHAGQMRY